MCYFVYKNSDGNYYLVFDIILLKFMWRMKHGTIYKNTDGRDLSDT